MVASLYRYDKTYFDKCAQETGFIRDNLEKVYRLADILEYINQNPFLKDSIALKGGTAINLTVFNLPRLSVDIDLDFCVATTREEMLIYRQKINDDLITYLQTQEYFLNIEKGKNPHSLDSWVFWYINTSGNRDNIKIEINYSLRNHILEIVESYVQTDVLNKSFKVNALSPIELFGSKIKALIERCAARDLYDVSNMIKFSLFDETELPLLKKCILFYLAVGGSKPLGRDFDLSAIEGLKWRNIQQTLMPVLRRKENFDFESAKVNVKKFIKDILVLDKNEILFIEHFSQKEYMPELLFDKDDILDRIKTHPMAIWKMRK